MSAIENLNIVSRTPELIRGRWFPTYTKSSDFRKPWWQEVYVEEAPKNHHWVSVVQEDREVARCKYVTLAPHRNNVLGDFPNGQLDILAFEVAASLRRHGFGRAVIQAIRDRNLNYRLTALNDNAESRKFWDGIGWIRHENPLPFFKDLERVTYSAPE